MLKQLLKDSARKAIAGSTRLLRAAPGGQYAYQQLLENGMADQRTAEHNGARMVFTTPNALCRYRVSSFSTKEPETLVWLDELPDDAILWDIGANVGLYSIYAATRRKVRVYAFEPSVFNLELLTRNIFLNALQHRIAIVPFALSNAVGTSLFKMSSTHWGGALSTFGTDYGQDGRPLKTQFEYQTCGMPMDDVVRHFGIPAPTHIKMDVDGIEHLILAGGQAVLAQVQSVLVEINDDFPEQADTAARLLTAAGLVLYRKCAMPDAGNQFNQWWTRPAARFA